ncbi:MAG: BspA family leucine-rich repeat surface protein, partial [Microthrixaceae bacterium]|nr:BspA family leucine-rich repeat surface protein [Microthrixaceae bacterium]
MVLLVAVWDLSHNWLAFACTGAYTVDWGDGSAPANVASGVKASHDFAWADIDSGTLSVHGYRQAIVTITPQAGQHLTSLSFSQPHVGAGGGVSNGTLEAVLAVPYATSFTFYNSATVAMDNRYLEHVSIVDAPSLITAYQMFAGMNALQKVDAPDATGAWTSTITNFSQMFSNCSSLREAPLLNTSAGTTFSQMFNNCSSLREVPLLNTSAGTNFSEMFRNCYSLREVPA